MRRTPCITTAATPDALAAVFNTCVLARPVAFGIDASAARPLIADKLKAAVSPRSNQLGVTPPLCAASHISLVVRTALKMIQRRSPHRPRPSVRCRRIIQFNHMAASRSYTPTQYVPIPRQAA